MNFEEFKSIHQKKEVVEKDNSVIDSLMVSVCVQTYQHVDYIRECLEGILFQKTNFSFEILLGEDGSTDGTREICIEYAEKFPNKIRLFLHHRENNIKIGGKPTGRFNFIYNLFSARGKYVAVCEGDDYWTDPFKLQKQVDFLETNEEYQICFHDVEVLYQKQKQKLADKITRVVPPTSGIEDLAKGNFIHTPSVIIRNDFIIPDWFTSSALGDWTLYMCAVGGKKIKKIEEIMGCYRIHETSIWSSKKPEQRVNLTLKTMELVYDNLEVPSNARFILQNRINELKKELSAFRVINQKDNSGPLVSVCIPTFNGENFLLEALFSVSNQTYRNIECIISDDKSRDSTLTILNKFKKDVDFDVSIYHHQPTTIGANWNACVRKAKGKYIKFLFQDDVLFPTCIEEMVKVAEGHQEVGLVASKRNFIVDEGVNEEIKRWILLYKDLQKNLGLGQEEVSFIDRNLLKKEVFSEFPYNKIGEPTAVLFPKALIGKTGLFREDLHQILDYEFYYRILKVKKIAIINKDLVSFRLHPLQATNVNRNREIRDYEIYEKILYKEFFWYLSRKEQKRLLKRFNPKAVAIIRAVKKLFA